MMKIFKKIFCGSYTYPHDWEVIEIRSEYKRFNNIWHRIPNIEMISNRGFKNCAVRKICLKCGKRIDEITEAQTQIRLQSKKNDERRSLARKMWEENKNNN